MKISTKAKDELKQILNTSYGNDFSDEDVNEIGVYILNLLYESLKLKIS